MHRRDPQGTGRFGNRLLAAQDFQDGRRPPLS
jgi:hypothetical protein